MARRIHPAVNAPEGQSGERYGIIFEDFWMSIDPRSRFFRFANAASVTALFECLELRFVVYEPANVEKYPETGNRSILVQAFRETGVAGTREERKGSEGKTDLV
jgi:hypothetical protein